MRLRHRRGSVFAVEMPLVQWQDEDAPAATPAAAHALRIGRPISTTGRAV